MKNFRYRSIGPYAVFKDLARAVKANNAAAIYEAAEKMKDVLPKNAVLVPMPSHSSTAGHAYALCRALSAKTGLPMCVALAGKPRRSLCEIKRAEWIAGRPKGSLLPSPDELGMYRTTATLPEGVPVIIDNVVASGTTAAAALKALNSPEAYVLALADDEGYPKIAGIEKVW